MTARRTIALLAACASLAAARPSGAAAPAIARVEGAVTGSDLTVTMWYADRARVPAVSYAPDRDGGWGCQLYLQGGSVRIEVDGIQEKDGVAPVLSLDAQPGAGLWSARLLGAAAMEPRPR